MVSWRTQKVYVFKVWYRVNKQVILWYSKMYYKIFTGCSETCYKLPSIIWALWIWLYIWCYWKSLAFRSKWRSKYERKHKVRWDFEKWVDWWHNDSYWPWRGVNFFLILVWKVTNKRLAAMTWFIKIRKWLQHHQVCTHQCLELKIVDRII